MVEFNGWKPECMERTSYPPGGSDTSRAAPPPGRKSGIFRLRYHDLSGIWLSEIITPGHFRPPPTPRGHAAAPEAYSVFRLRQRRPGARPASTRPHPVGPVGNSAAA